MVQKKKTVFFQYYSDVSQWRCSCVKQQFQLKATVLLYFIQYCSWWLWYPLVASPIFDGDGLSNGRPLYGKNSNCFMIHGGVSYCDCVVHVSATRQRPTTSSEEDFFFVPVSLYFKMIWKKKSLTHQAFMHTSIDTN